MQTYLESWAAKRKRKADFEAAIAGFDDRIQRKLSFAYAREADALKEAEKEFRHAAQARIATKKHYRDVQEKKLGERGWIVQAKRTRARKAELKAVRKADKLKEELRESRHSYEQLIRDAKQKAKTYEEKREELISYVKARKGASLEERIETGKKVYRTRNKNYRQGRYLYYEIGMCPESPPCTKVEERIESRLEYIDARRNVGSEALKDKKKRMLRERGTDDNRLRMYNVRIVQFRG